MSLYYDELIAADSFEQIDLKSPKSSERSSTSAAMTTSNDKSESSLVDELGFPLEQLFQMARQFLKGNFVRIHRLDSFVDSIRKTRQSRNSIEICRYNSFRCSFETGNHW